MGWLQIMYNMKELIKGARAVLEKNWMGDYTRPSALLYPHQWSWDSGFIAMGYSTFDQKRAQTELRSLFRGQWKNGMIPHIVYTQNSSDAYFPDAEFWNATISEQAPHGVQTSGITQPPVHAIAALTIYKRARDRKSAHEFLNEMYPKLFASHRFFYTVRDPLGEGLAYIRHPWASGLDNSPTWDAPLQRIELGDPRDFERKDLKSGVPREQRPEDWDYNRYIYLVELFKEQVYDEAELFKTCPFLLQDTLVNSILVRANQALAEIAVILGKDQSQINRWTEKTVKGINRKLWHKGHGFYDAFDLRSNEIIEVDTASGFAPLYGGVPSRSHARKLYKYLDSNSFCSMHEKKCFSIPNYNLEGEYFDPVNYWRGPIWINMNWMLMQGLRRYGFSDKAESVKTDIIKLVRRYGFYEYYDPIKGRGYGASDFSWTAALFLDTIFDDKSD
jgi:glycogen debranching enzyme